LQKLQVKIFNNSITLNTTNGMKFALRCKPGQKIKKTGKKVAIIGSGPAGLAAAGYLVCEGHEVHVYERLPEPGGMLMFAIPSYRIPKENIRKGIRELIDLGVKFHLETKIIGEPEPCTEGDELIKRKIKFEELLNDYDAILITTGTWSSRRIGIPGEKLKGVYSALDYLFKIRAYELSYLPKEAVHPTGKKVAVIGAGLAAIDASEEALRQGAKEVCILYRRTINEAPAGEYEIKRILKKGVKFIELVSPIEFVGTEKLEYIKLIRMKLGAPDESGRPRPEPVPKSEFIMEFDTVLLAIGEIPTPPFTREYSGIKIGKNGRIQVDEKYRTTRKGVFAAGDVVTGPSRVGLAMKSGINAAIAIDEYLNGKLKW